MKPAMPFSGVRISWLIVARKRLFERSPSDARSSASRIAASLRLASVMSSKIVTKQVSRPLPSLTGLTQPRTGKSSPFLRRLYHSFRQGFPARTVATRSASASGESRAGGNHASTGPPAPPPGSRSGGRARR